MLVSGRIVTIVNEFYAKSEERRKFKSHTDGTYTKIGAGTTKAIKNLGSLSEVLIFDLELRIMKV